jgi:hypothetical protein
MTDTDQPKEFKAHEPKPPPRHPCDTPGLGPLEFLLAVMHDQTFPITIRIKAAEGAAPYLTSRPGKSRYPCVPYHMTYVIPDHPRLREACEPRTPSTEDPEQNNEKSQSFSSPPPNSCQPQCGDPGTLNTERRTEDLSFEQIRELIRTTDFDNLPLCECGHRMPFPCKPVRTN